MIEEIKHGFSTVITLQSVENFLGCGKRGENFFWGHADLMETTVKTYIYRYILLTSKKLLKLD